MAGAADWALTDTIRDRIFKRLALGCALVEEVRTLADWLHPQSDSFRCDLINGDEEETRFTGTPKFVITACALETDTDSEGRVWGSLVDGTPNTINVYKEQGRSTLVATGTASDGATLTLAPQTGYTLAGTVALGTISANASFALKITPPAVKLISAAFNGDEEDDQQNAETFLRQLVAARSGLMQAAAALASANAFLVRTTFRRRLVARSSESVLINPGLRRLSTGQVEERPTGLLEDLYLAMEANSGGSGAMKCGGPTQSASTGEATGTDVTFTTTTLGKRGVPGVITAVCVKSLDGSGDPEFDLFYDPSDTRRKPGDGTQSIALPNRLRLGKTWKCPEAGVEALLVDYTPSVSNSSGTSLSTTASDWIRPSGLKDSLSDGGILYTYYESSTTRLEFYKTSAGRDAQDEDELVTYATLGTSAVNTAFTTEDIGNGLVITGKTGAGTASLLVDGNKGSVNFQPPVATQPASRFTVTISETVRGGMHLRAWRDGYLGGTPGSPSQTAAGWEPYVSTSPNILDAWIRARTLSQHVNVSHRRG